MDPNQPSSCKGLTGTTIATATFVAIWLPVGLLTLVGCGSQTKTAPPPPVVPVLSGVSLESANINGLDTAHGRAEITIGEPIHFTFTGSIRDPKSKDKLSIAGIIEVADKEGVIMQSTVFDSLTFPTADTFEIQAQMTAIHESITREEATIVVTGSAGKIGEIPCKLVREK